MNIATLISQLDRKPPDRSAEYAAAYQELVENGTRMELGAPIILDPAEVKATLSNAGKTGDDLLADVGQHVESARVIETDNTEVLAAILDRLTAVRSGAGDWKDRENLRSAFFTLTLAHRALSRHLQLPATATTSEVVPLDRAMPELLSIASDLNKVSVLGDAIDDCVLFCLHAAGVLENAITGKLLINTQAAALLNAA